MAMIGQGMGMIIASLTSKYRDLSHLVNFGTQLLMYISPVIYPLSSVPEFYKKLIFMNPMTPVIEIFRFTLFKTGEISLSMISLSIFSTIFIFLLGLLVFNKVEKNIYRYHMSETVIEIKDLSKIYKLGVISTGSFASDLTSKIYTIIGLEDPNSKLYPRHNDKSTKKVALSKLNLKIKKKGEILGVIGKNGAGKSTLLKILSRITAPTSGYAKIIGRTSSLLEVGTGFHPELTGRENIFLNGSIMGMTKREIRLKLNEIIDFSGIKEYIDTPVKRYSSGMIVRLGFSIAAHLEPEILFIDEVLAVGDLDFQKKMSWEN